MKEKVKIEGIAIKCDKCGDYYDWGDGRAIIPDDLDGEQIEEFALEDGWVVDGDKHYCPDCVKKV